MTSPLLNRSVGACRLACVALMTVLWFVCSSTVWGQAAVAIPRDFTIALPLFPQGAWIQEAASAAVLPASDQQILVTYQVLCGDTTDMVPATSVPITTWPFADINYDDYAVPIFRAGAATQSVGLCDYEGNLSWPGPKWQNNVEGGPITVPSCAGQVRPAGPQDTDADGHLVLFDVGSDKSYDFWQATTVLAGPCQSSGGGLTGSVIHETGAADHFPAYGDGTNLEGLSSARAMGTPLLAGMILPEDVMSGTISHALAFAIPGPRNTADNPQEPIAEDVFYPASTTETDFYSTNPNALAAGQRLRMKQSLVDEIGDPVNESLLAPITRMFIAAVRTYGAYVVDNAGGFSFSAEDIHTGVLPLDDEDVNTLAGRVPTAPLPGDKTRWQLVIEALNADLETIPFAFGPCSVGSSSVTTANYELVEPASPSGSVIFADGFESGQTDRWSASVGK